MTKFLILLRLIIIVSPAVHASHMPRQELYVDDCLWDGNMCGNPDEDESEILETPCCTTETNIDKKVMTCWRKVILSCHGFIMKKQQRTLNYMYVVIWVIHKMVLHWNIY